MIDEPQPIAHEGTSYPEESFESLYEDAPCGYLSTLPDGRFIRFNRTLLDWTGYRRELLLHLRNFRDLLTVGGRMYYETHYAPLLAMQGTVSEIALDIVRSDGSSFPALLNAVLQRDGNGRPLLIRTMVMAACDRRRYERELLAQRREAEFTSKAKTDFVSMLSHDIRSPLSAVVGVAEMLEQSPLSATQQSYVRLLKSGGESLMALVNNVLDDSKLESGKMTLDVKPLELNTLILENLTRLRIKAEQKGLKLSARFDERIPQVLLGDRVKLSQIFTNLIGNAIKFTPEGSVEVVVTLEALVEGEARVGVEILDTGIGVDPQHCADIFDEYTQARQSHGDDVDGWGLGLSISRKLIALHGGTITASRRAGGGSVFRFCLCLPVA